MGPLLCFIDAQRAMWLLVLVAANYKSKGTRSCYLTLLDLLAKFTMQQNMIYGWSQILRDGVHPSVARTYQSS